mmetsp:Transcript_19269/g.46546  ORF Transcript_19269/g.46546 Transcript_19269/m.46546 type:complete len:616 (-) Transcript_19269:243-2090(-)
MFATMFSSMERLCGHCDPDEGIYFAEPELPTPGGGFSDGVILSNNKSLTEVSLLTENSDLQNSSSMNDSIGNDTTSQKKIDNSLIVNDDEDDDQIAQFILYKTSSLHCIMDCEVNGAEQNGTQLLCIAEKEAFPLVEAAATTSTDILQQRKGLARSRMDSSSTTMRVQKEVLEMASLSSPGSSPVVSVKKTYPKSKSMATTTSTTMSLLTPRTVDTTVDLTTSSAMSTSGYHSSCNSNSSDNMNGISVVLASDVSNSVTRSLFTDVEGWDVGDVLDGGATTTSASSIIVYSRRKRSLTINVDECTKSQFKDLLQRLNNHKDNNTVNGMQICRTSEPRNGCVRTLPELRQFFSAVRRLPNIEDVKLWNFNEECTDVIKSFVNHQSKLERFHLHYTRGTVDNAFLESLAASPSLKNTVLELQREFSLSILLRSKTITSMKVDGNFYFGKLAFLQFTEALRTNKTLACLDLKPTIHILGLRALAHSMEGNTAVRKLKFSYRPSTINEADVALQDLTASLSKNKTLEHVENRHYDMVQVTSPDQKRKVEDLLKSNSNLQRFQFFIENNTNEDVGGTNVLIYGAGDRLSNATETKSDKNTTNPFHQLAKPLMNLVQCSCY